MVTENIITNLSAFHPGGGKKLFGDFLVPVFRFDLTSGMLVLMSGCEKYVRLIQVYGISETYFCRPYTWGYKKNIYKYPGNNNICMATIVLRMHTEMERSPGSVVFPCKHWYPWRSNLSNIGTVVIAGNTRSRTLLHNLVKDFSCRI